MCEQARLHELTQAFRLLGADDPSSWAVSEFEDGIPQLAMYVFLKRARAFFGPERTDRWLQSLAHGNAPEHSAAKLALQRLTGCGALRDDLREVVIAFGRDMLMEWCCLLDNISARHFENEHLNKAVAEVNWRLYVVDADCNPTTPMDGLHELVADVDDPIDSVREETDSC